MPVGDTHNARRWAPAGARQGVKKGVKRADFEGSLKWPRLGRLADDKIVGATSRLWVPISSFADDKMVVMSQCRIPAR